MSEKNDLDILIPDYDITLDSGEIVVIKPFSFAKLPKVVSLINSIGVGVFALLEARNGIQVEAGEQADGMATLEIDDMVVNKVNEFIESHFDEVVDVLAIYCRQPKEFFLDEEKGPNVEEACQILLTIVERHLGFFTKTLRPIMARIKEKAQPGTKS
ncbi:hypothetical protein SRRS_07200 [Sporomusa rhizae]|uniref:hypothetical protein n=1 Tax=Sporomusa rhizae TaxID=357999 RepID=UPI003529E311